MTPAKAEKLLKEINTPGTELNKKYLSWINNGMTDLMAELMYFLSSPEKCVAKVANVQGVGDNPASTLLGYTLGRSHMVTEMLELNMLEAMPSEEVQDDFNGIED